MARKLVPTDTAGQLKLVWNRLTYALGGYFRAQFKIMGIVGIILFVGFLVMRIEYAVFLALIIAVLDFLPMLGTGTVMIPGRCIWCCAVISRWQPGLDDPLCRDSGHKTADPARRW